MINVVRFMLSLDADGIPDNGIDLRGIEARVGDAIVRVGETWVPVVNDSTLEVIKLVETAVSSGLANWPLLMASLAIASLGMAPAFVYLWPKWWDSFTYSHGLLILAISMWLIWQLWSASLYFY